MRVITLKAKPKTIFALVMIATGLLVIAISFAMNHNGALPSNAEAEISCATTKERVAYINSLGWETDGCEQSKDIAIPEKFNEVYTEYNKIQTSQGFDLEKHKGESATIYTYNITNYGDSNSVIADLIVQNGRLLGADLCDTDVENGFLVALEHKTDGQN